MEYSKVEEGEDLEDKSAEFNWENDAWDETP